MADRTFDLQSWLREHFDAPNLAAYYDNRNTPTEPYIGAALFPSMTVASRELRYVKGKAGLPIALRASALDANAPLREYIGLQMVKNEIPFFREGATINEQMIMDLQVALSMGDNYAASAIRDIYELQSGLVFGAEVTAERMRMQLLQNGSINIRDPKDNVPIYADYGFDPATQAVVLTGAQKWDAVETSDPVTDIVNAMEKVNLNSARVILTQNTWNKVKASANIKKSIYPGNNMPPILTPGVVQDWLTSNFNITFLVITPRQNSFVMESDRNADGSYPTHHFFKDGVATLIPTDGTLGNTCYGPTPEGLTAGMSQAQTSIVGTGVAIRTWQDPHTVNMHTVVSQTVLPSFQRISEMFIINAY